MSKNRELDELEKFIKNKFDESIANKEDWTNPTDYIFMSAMKEVDAIPLPEPKRNWRLMTLIPLLLLALVGVFFMVDNDAKDENSVGLVSENVASLATKKQKENKDRVSLSSQSKSKNSSVGNNSYATKQQNVNELSDNSKNIEKANNNTNSSNIGIESNPKFGDTNLATSEKEGSLRTVSGEEFLSSSSINSAANKLSNNLKKSTNSPSLNLNANPTTNATKSSAINLVQKDEAIGLDSNTDDSSLALISFIPGLGNELYTYTETVPLTIGFHPIVETASTVKDDRNLSHSFILIGTRLNKFSAPSSNPSVAMEGHNKLRLGYLAGAGFSAKLVKNLSFNAGFYLSSYKIMSNYSDSMVFDEANLFIGQSGSEFYNASISLESPLGVTQVDEPMVAELSNIEDNSIMDMNVNFKQQFKSLEFDAGLSYNVLQIGKLNASIFAGANFMRLVDYEEWFNVDVYDEGSLFLNVEKTHSPEEKLNKWLIGGELGLTINYDFTNHIFGGFKSSYFQSFNAVNGYQHENNNANINTLNFSLYAGYKF